MLKIVKGKDRKGEARWTFCNENVKKLREFRGSFDGNPQIDGRVEFDYWKLRATLMDALPGRKKFHVNHGAIPIVNGF